LAIGKRHIVAHNPNGRKCLQQRVFCNSGQKLKYSSEGVDETDGVCQEKCGAKKIEYILPLPVAGWYNEPVRLNEHHGCALR